MTPYDSTVSSRRRAVTAALLASASLAGCGAGSDDLLERAASSANATDAAFARAMAAHQRTTGSIAQLGGRRALRPELRRIARTTFERHEKVLPVLVDARNDLRGRGVSPVGGGIEEPPPFDRRGLRNAVSFDHDFLKRMIQQHEYTVAAADTERARGGDMRLKALAQDAYDSSRRDLAILRRWLATWYGQTQPNEPRVPPPGGGGGSGGKGSDPPV